MVHMKKRAVLDDDDVVELMLLESSAPGSAIADSSFFFTNFSRLTCAMKHNKKCCETRCDGGNFFVRHGATRGKGLV